MIALVVLADGADVMLFRTTDAIASYTPARTVAAQIDGASDITYGKFLSWRGEVAHRAAASPGARSHLRIGVGPHRGMEVRRSSDRATATSGELHMPPARVSRVGDTVDDMTPAPMADVQGTIALLTIDRIAYSPSPPVAFAVVDWDGGGRLPGRAHRRRRRPRCRWATASR